MTKKTVNWHLAIEPEYFEVLAKIDATNDPRLLLPYLNVPARVLPHFQDLFERKQFTRRKGKTGQRSVRRDPSYMISEKLFYLPAVMAEYHEARRKGASVAEAKAVAREGCPSVSEKDIDAVIKGQHRAYREADFGLAIKAWEAFRKGRSGKKLSDEELDLVKLYVELMKAEPERGPRVSLARFPKLQRLLLLVSCFGRDRRRIRFKFRQMSFRESERVPDTSCERLCYFCRVQVVQVFYGSVLPRGGKLPRLYSYSSATTAVEDYVPYLTGMLRC